MESLTTLPFSMALPAHETNTTTSASTTPDSTENHFIRAVSIVVAVSLLFFATLPTLVALSLSFLTAAYTLSDLCACCCICLAALAEEEEEGARYRHPHAATSGTPYTGHSHNYGRQGRTDGYQTPTRATDGQLIGQPDLYSSQQYTTPGFSQPPPPPANTPRETGTGVRQRSRTRDGQQYGRPPQQPYFDTPHPNRGHTSMDGSTFLTGGRAQTGSLLGQPDLKGKTGGTSSRDTRRAGGGSLIGQPTGY